jgi:competence protein ComEA
MRRVKAFIRKFFSLSRGETNGFLILVPLMAIILFSEPLYRAWSIGQAPSKAANEDDLDVLIAKWEWEKEKIDSVRTIPRPKFLFDPNKASKEQFIELGFSQALAQRIINYRTKGGTFKIQSDVQKIYGVDSVFYNQLVPFINLPNAYVKAEAVEPKRIGLAAPERLSFDINLADTAQLKKIYGIGNVLSLRIISYRDKLGGFVSEEQLREVYGLDSAVLKQLNEKVFINQDFHPRLLNANDATERDLALHPYIKSKLAKAITTYRFQHGNFASIEDLQKIALIDNETFGKIKPYLVVNK